jgi:hypothetical protein
MMFRSAAAGGRDRPGGLQAAPLGPHRSTLLTCGRYVQGAGPALRGVEPRQVPRRGAESREHRSRGDDEHNRRDQGTRRASPRAAPRSSPSRACCADSGPADFSLRGNADRSEDSRSLSELLFLCWTGGLHDERRVRLAATAHRGLRHGRQEPAARVLGGRGLRQAAGAAALALRAAPLRHAGACTAPLRRGQRHQPPFPVQPGGAPPVPRPPPAPAMRAAPPAAPQPARRRSRGGPAA